MNINSSSRLWKYCSLLNVKDLHKYTAQPLNNLREISKLKRPQHSVPPPCRTSSIPCDFQIKTEDIKAALKRCWGRSRYRRETACVWEWALSFKLQSTVVSQHTLSGSPAWEGSGSFSSDNTSFPSSVSADPSRWSSCSISRTAATTSLTFSSSLTLCTMTRCLLRDSSDVKHRPQWRHWGVFSSVLCCGICCWNCVLSSVMKPHFEQRNWLFRRFADGAPMPEVRSRSSLCAFTAGLSDTSPCKSQSHILNWWL